MSELWRAESTRLKRFEDGGYRAAQDWLAAEEPLEICVATADEEHRLVVTMRTPGHDAELAVGFLVAEGLLRVRRDVVSVDHPSDPRIAEELQENTIVVQIRSGLDLDLDARRRNFLMTGACGVCGRTVIDDLFDRLPSTVEPTVMVSPTTVMTLTSKLRKTQELFAKTGGLHAAGLFQADGELLSVREDIGRHNALDKLLGEAWLAEDWPLTGNAVVVSGRAGFELVQKSLVAGAEILVAVGAPSSLAVELAARGGLTLIGFARDGRFNTYTGYERVEGLT